MGRVWCTQQGKGCGWESRRLSSAWVRGKPFKRGARCTPLLACACSERRARCGYNNPGPRKAGVLSVMAPTALAATRGEAGPPLRLHARPAGGLACGWRAQTHFTALTLQNLELGP